MIGFLKRRKNRDAAAAAAVASTMAPGMLFGGMDMMGPSMDAIFHAQRTGDYSGIYQLQAARAEKPAHISIGKAIRLHWEARAIQKAVEKDYWQSELRARKAGVQQTMVNATLDMFGADYMGVVDKSGLTMRFLRGMAQDCEVVAAIIGKRVEQVKAFGRVSQDRSMRTKDPGYMVRMTKKSAKATDADTQAIEELEQFIAECGYTPPPEENRSPQWQPGFENFLAQIVRDRLTLDQVALRRWADGVQPDKYPLVCFAAEDAGQIQRKERRFERIDDNGVPVFVDADQHRTNTKRRITSVRKDDGGTIIEEFTDEELVLAHARARTDRNAKGYGFSELEELVNTCTMWCAGREFNSTRFHKDQLPRGVISMLGNIDQQSYDSFVTNWTSQVQGVMKRWSIPIVKGTAAAGSSVQWIPFDLSPKDMEHLQTMFTMAVWAHSIYQIHPEETGFAASSPYKPPLSEASPETNLKYSQDSGLRPLLRWIEGLINREIVWKMFPDRRYSFTFVGTGDYDETVEAQTWTMKLQAGMCTPNMMWDALDIVMPEEIRNHPAADFPAPFAVGMQMIQSMTQQQQQQDMAQQQQQQQGQQQQFSQGLERFRAASEGYDQQQAEGGGSAPGGATPMGTPPGTNNPASPILKSVGWPFV